MPRPTAVLRVALAAAWIAAPLAAFEDPPFPATGRAFVVDSPLDAHDASPGDGFCVAALATTAAKVAAVEVCTLRAAVEEGVASGGGTVITLPLDVYELGAEILVANGAWVVVAGPANGDRPLIQREAASSGSVRLFDVAANATLGLQRVTLANGRLLDGGGGLVRSQGYLAVDRCDLLGGRALTGGGAVQMNSGRISDSLVASNACLAPQSSGTLQTPVEKAAAPCSGGGVRIDGGASLLERTTIASNVADGPGGGLAVYGGDVQLVDSTIAGNAVSTLVVGVGRGGGVYVAGGTLRVASSTIAVNYLEIPEVAMPHRGAGIDVQAGAAVSVRNSILARNLVPGVIETEPLGDDCDGAIGVLGFNLIQAPGATCAYGGAGNKVGVDPGFGTLDDHGGPTPTLDVAHDGPAVDAGDPAGCLDPEGALLTKDQRGIPRALAGRCDMGAFEADLVFRDGFESGGTGGWSSSS